MRCNFTLLLLFLFSISIQGQEKTDTLSVDLQITQLSEHVYIHKSFTDSEQFGRYSSNGLIYISDGKAIIADTPPTNELSQLLIDWLINQSISIEAVVVNHFHEDALGGLSVFHEQKIPSFGYSKTKVLAEATGATPPQNTFMDSLNFEIGTQVLTAYYFGEAHTIDNTLFWFPTDRVLFGGCMLKSLGSGKGNLADANVEEWAKTVQKITDYFPTAEIVIPGHGKYGTTELLDFTIHLFEQ